MPILFLVGFLVLGIILCISSARHYKIKKIRMLLGIISLILGFSSMLFTFNLEAKVAERGASMISEEIVEYQLVSLQADTAISGNGSRFYLEVSEKTVFHFYYKTTKNGKEGFSPKTITSTDVFIDETYECAPFIREIKTTYDYQYTEFEKWWFQEYLTSLKPYTQTSYEIYVPTGSIIESYNFK